MTDPAIAAVASVVSATLGIFSKALWDKQRHHNGRPTRADRDDIIFQTTIKIAMESLTDSVTRVNEQFLQRQMLMTEAMTEAASAIRSIHEEIREHRQEAQRAIDASIETNRMVRELYQKKLGSYERPV